MTRFRLSRRALLLGAGTAAVVAPASAEQPGVTPCLVCVFLRGAADALNLVVPYADAEYYELRPGIAVAEPGKPHGALKLDERFGLHPALAPLKPAYDAGELAFVHAVGSPHPTRSHFQAQDYMESGSPGASTGSGWLARCLERDAARPRGELPAVALSSRLPLALRGTARALAAESVKQLALGKPKGFGSELERGFARLYASGDEPATRAGRDALVAAARLQALRKSTYQPENGASYERAARPFQEIASLLKADLGLEAAWIDVGGWDTHTGQGNGENGALKRRLEPLGRALAAFRADLGARLQHVVVLVMSEFGRTVRENGSGGTDHGHGTAMLVLGGNVHGGKVYGNFPGLAPEHLFEGRDLPVTTDYRLLFAELAEKHLGVRDAASLFPGDDWRGKPLGVMR